MTTTDNPRGYAFMALKGAYNKQLKWRQFAAANKYGYYPTFNEYRDEGLAMFDRMYAVATQDNDTAIAITQEIIKEMRRSMMSQFKGHFTYLKDEDGVEYVTTKHDVVLDQPVDTGNTYEASTLGDLIPVEEKGYEEFDSADLMRTRLGLIAQRLSDEDMTTLTSFIDGEHDTLTAACGGEKVRTALFQKRLRVACKSLKGSVVFG